jgi:hypothetical protein
MSVAAADPRNQPAQARLTTPKSTVSTAAGSASPPAPGQAPQCDPGLVQRLKKRVRPVGIALDQAQFGTARASRMLITGGPVAHEVRMHAGEEFMPF